MTRWLDRIPDRPGVQTGRPLIAEKRGGLRKDNEAQGGPFKQ